MDRVKLPSPDAADRRVLGIALLAGLAFLVLCLVVGAGLGAGVMMFKLMSGG